MPDLLRHLVRGQRGQTSIEYVGAILVICIIVGVLITAAPDLGATLVRGVRSQIDSILGG